MTVPERATLYAMANRLWGSAGGLLTAALVASCFSPTLQGYYYTFLSLLTLQTFVELGFGELLQQFASHEWARASSSDPRERERARGRLAALLRLSLTWYAVAAVVLLAALGLAGSLYFRAFGAGDGVAWELHWWLAVFFTAASALATPFFALLEGANRIETVHGVRLSQGIASRIAGFGAILAGGGLVTVPLVRAVSLVAGAIGLGRESAGLVRRFWASGPAREAVSWKRELWPLQWKFALSWISGFVVYSLFTPMLFAFHGAPLAGQMGMTLAAASAISSAAFAVMATKVPRLAIHAAEREFPEMDALFRRATLSAIAVSGAGAGLFLGGLVAARELGSPLAARFLPLLPTSILLLAVVLQQLRFAMGSYLRAHKKEPFFALAVFEAAAAVPLLALLGRSFGALGMVLGFFGLTTATLVPAASIFGRCRTLWHRPSLSES